MLSSAKGIIRATGEGDSQWIEIGFTNLTEALWEYDGKEVLITIEEIDKKTKREIGYYWIKFKDDLDDICIGYYDGDKNEDGSDNHLPWNICGSDDIFEDDELIVLEKIKDYEPCVWHNEPSFNK